MKYRELTELMKAVGWYFERNGKGSHRIWRHPDKENPLTVPNHGSKEISPGLVRKIKKEAGIE